MHLRARLEHQLNMLWEEGRGHCFKSTTAADKPSCFFPSEVQRYQTQCELTLESATTTERVQIQAAEIPGVQYAVTCPALLVIAEFADAVCSCTGGRIPTAQAAFRLAAGVLACLCCSSLMTSSTRQRRESGCCALVRGPAGSPLAGEALSGSTQISVLTAGAVRELCRLSCCMQWSAAVPAGLSTLHEVRRGLPCNTALLWP